VRIDATRRARPALMTPRIDQLAAQQ